jgi:hypothetical protein
MTLVEFLLARLAEDEAAALAATPGPWELRDLGDETFNSDDRAGWWWVWRKDVPHYAGVMEVDHADPEMPIGVAAITDHDRGAPERSDAEHIARWNPARVLAEVAAKRAILTEIERILPVCIDPMTPAGMVALAMAQPYADRPGFDPAWNVTA